MKPKFFAIALLFVSFGTAAFAQDKIATEPVTAIHFSEAITSLTINDNLTVVLTDGTSPDIRVEGAVKAVSVRLDDGHLILATRNPHQITQTVVYVPAGFLRKVFLNDAATVRSAATLKQDKLRIFVSGEGKIDVRSIGAITVETLNDVQFVKGR